MTAVRQDLHAKLIDQPVHIGSQKSGLPLHAKRRVIESDYRLQARQAVARLVERTTQIADLPRQATNKASIKTRIGILQHEWRLAEPADHAAREDIGTPSHLMP